MKKEKIIKIFNELFKKYCLRDVTLNNDDYMGVPYHYTSLNFKRSFIRRINKEEQTTGDKK